jgi:hypothetical protein
MEMTSVTVQGELAVRSATRLAPLHTTDNSSVVINPSVVRFLWPNGKELTPKQIQSRLVEGAAVLVCSTPDLPSPWQHVLNKRTIVIVQVLKPVMMSSDARGTRAQRNLNNLEEMTAPLVEERNAKSAQ